MDANRLGIMNLNPFQKQTARRIYASDEKFIADSELHVQDMNFAKEAARNSVHLTLVCTSGATP